MYDSYVKRSVGDDAWIVLVRAMFLIQNIRHTGIAHLVENVRAHLIN